MFVKRDARVLSFTAFLISAILPRLLISPYFRISLYFRIPPFSRSASPYFRIFPISFEATVIFPLVRSLATSVSLYFSPPLFPLLIY